MNNYYWESKHSRGWYKAKTDQEARKYFPGLPVTATCGEWSNREKKS